MGRVAKFSRALLHPSAEREVGEVDAAKPRPEGESHAPGARGLILFTFVVAAFPIRLAALRAAIHLPQKGKESAGAFSQLSPSWGGM
jgi:hypothetical protein